MPIALEIFMVVGCAIRVSSQQFEDFGSVKLLPELESLSEESVSGLKAAFCLNTFLLMRLNFSLSAQLIKLIWLAWFHLDLARITGPLIKKSGAKP